MNREKMIEAGVAGTTLMTLFSYGASIYEGKNFKEPELLSEFFPKQLQDFHLAVPAGWLTHYSMGISWAAVFQLLFNRKIVKPNMLNGMLLGTLSGIMAIAIWRSAFKLHSINPKISFKSFYRHLILAHLVYSLSVVEVYQKN
jgi:hypothetical protein